MFEERFDRLENLIFNLSNKLDSHMTALEGGVRAIKAEIIIIRQSSDRIIKNQEKQGS